MTKQEIQAIEAGAEMDALIAEKIMGEPCPPLIQEYPWWRSAPVYSPQKQWVASTDPSGSNSENHIWLPMPYSTSIHFAFYLEERLAQLIDESGTAKFNYLSLERLGRWAGFGAAFESGIRSDIESKDTEWFDRIEEYSFCATADTAALAICRAALMVVFDKENETTRT